MKGILLAGGSGTRMYPLTHSLSKQLLPVYDKPMIYYPLSTLMLLGIREILIITTPRDQPAFMTTLGDGSRWGVKLTYVEQTAPRGLADAFLVGERFIDGDQVCLILGDNLFYGHGLTEVLREAQQVKTGARIFGYYVKDPTQYGVVELSRDGKVLGLEEKPTKPKSNYAVPGIYFYDEQVVGLAKALKPSARGELEITDLNRVYLERGQLHFSIMTRGLAWLDTGSPDSLLQASNFIQTVENKQGLKIGCPEEIAYRMGFIDAQQIAALGTNLEKTEYGQYLLQLAKENRV
jgi:glucose-1-phosphate thymidylyltransferase